jgi:hypothetical protein
VGHIEDAKVALDVIARAIDDAVYLDEDAYNQMLPIQHYTRTIEVHISIWKFVSLSGYCSLQLICRGEPASVWPVHQYIKHYAGSR